MTAGSGFAVRVEVERSSRAISGLSEFEPFCVGRIHAPTGLPGGPAVDSRVVARLPGEGGAVEGRDYVPVPDTLGADAALMAPPLALCLWAWESLGLELGEAAVYTDGCPLAGLIGRVARWRGGLPIVKVVEGGDAPVADGPDTTIAARGDAAGVELASAVRERPGVAAVDLTGRPDMVDLLLESLPKWSRLMLAGRVREPLTMDLYRNVHLKGTSLIFSRFEPSLVFGGGNGPGDLLPNAFRLLEREGVAESLSVALSG